MFKDLAEPITSPEMRASIILYVLNKTPFVQEVNSLTLLHLVRFALLTVPRVSLQLYVLHVSMVIQSLRLLVFVNVRLLSLCKPECVWQLLRSQLSWHHNLQLSQLLQRLPVLLTPQKLLLNRQQQMLRLFWTKLIVLQLPQHWLNLKRQVKYL